VFREGHVRSFAKALSWRILGSVGTGLVIFIVTRRPVLSVAVGVGEFVAKIGAFWLHERIWDRLRFGREQIQPVVVWLTGLPASGKSSISNQVASELERKGFKVELLDGEFIRNLFPNAGFTRPERDEHVRRVGHLASRLEKQGVCVVAALVSPYAETRHFVRTICRNFIEVHVATPIEECERRDTKGLYARARRGDIAHFTGVDDPYEEPTAPDLRLDTRHLSVEEAARKVMETVERRLRQPF
jgi:adenylylsulfate kinase